MNMPKVLGAPQTSASELFLAQNTIHENWSRFWMSGFCPGQGPCVYIFIYIHIHTRFITFTTRDAVAYHWTWRYFRLPFFSFFSLRFVIRPAGGGEGVLWFGHAIQVASTSQSARSKTHQWWSLAWCCFVRVRLCARKQITWSSPNKKTKQKKLS